MGSPIKDLIDKVMLSHPLLSIVIPVFNEEHNIDLLIESIEKELSNYSYELIFIDDFSTDGTRKVIETHPNHIEFLSLLRAIKVKVPHLQQVLNMRVASISLQWMETFKMIHRIYQKCYI